ncbi:hypothetical protein [Vreelandella malpeensis]|uniref:hypothetical protein n=1 Tax=Vreelandella malpeensis TaxID=1172368 RepID=UPI0030846221
MEKATVFKDKLGQTVRFSEAMALPENVTHVEVTALGRARLIIPAEEDGTAGSMGQLLLQTL